MSIPAQALGNAVTTPAPRKGFGELFAEKKDKLDRFQKQMAGVLPAMPGQSVAKFYDLAMGIDFHSSVFPPSPLLPVPHIGMIFDIMGAVMSAIASVLPEPPPPPPVKEGEEPPEQPVTLASVCTAIVNAMKPSVQVHGRWVANAGTGIQHLPGIVAHIPFPVITPMASSEMFMGSSTVLADGGPCSTRFHPALSCNLVGFPAMPRMNKPKTRMALMAPTSMLLIETSGGKPVLVGGPPTIDLFQLGFQLALKGMGKLWKRTGKGLQKVADRVKPKNPRLGNVLQFIKCRLFGEPVDAVTGRVYANHTDFSLPGPIPFIWKRTYYSDAEVNGPLGYNWHHSYNMGIYNMGNGGVTLRLQDGREIAMPAVAYGDVGYDRSEQLFLTCDAMGWLVTDADKLQYRFQAPTNQEGFHMLSSIATTDGVAIHFDYDARGCLREITDSRGQVIAVDTDTEGRILRLYTFANGTTVVFIEYRYDEQGNMMYTGDASGGHRYFTYNGHLLVEYRNAMEQRFYWEYEGNGDSARCIHTWGDGGILEYWASYTEGLTVVRNSLGFTTHYYYDERKLIYKIEDGAGGITRQVYNEHGEPEVLINPGGLSQRFEYNVYGRLIKAVNENELATSFSYDERLNLISIQQPSGATISWEYDNLDRIRTKQFPDGRRLQFTYEGVYMNAITDGSGRSVHFYFNNRHDLVKQTYPNGSFQQWKYDDLGNTVQITDAGGNITTCSYDNAGNIVAMEEPDGNRQFFTYDANANLIHARDDLREVRFSYGSLGVLLSRTQNGRKIKYVYDTELQLKSIANESGEVYRFSLDGIGNVVSEWGFDGLNRRYERDAAGRVKRILRPNNQWVAYEYDGTGNVVSEQYDDDSGTAFKYNKDGLLIAAQNADTGIRLIRNKAGKVIQEIQGGYTVERTYDSEGNAVLLKSNLGASVLFEHDRMGSVTRMQSGDWQAEWLYDMQGLELQRKMSGGVSVVTERDKLGRVIGRTIETAYREINRTRYKWGRGNRLLQISSGIGKSVTDFDYDEWDNLTCATYSVAQDVEKVYRLPDKIGNLFHSTDQKESAYGKGGQLVQNEKYNYYYDREGNRIFKEFRKNNGIVVKDKQLLEKELGIVFTGSASGWRYHWHSNGLLHKVILPHGGEVVYYYDALARRIAREYKGSVTRWVWDGNVVLHEWSYEGSFPPGRLIDESGALTEVKEPVTNVTTWLYEEGSLVPCARQEGAEHYSVVADYMGTPTHAFDKAGNKVWERDLDCYGKVRNETGRTGMVLHTWQGQWLDAETGLSYNRFRYYDPETGHYLSQDPIRLEGGYHLYAYVHDPNTWLDPFGLNLVNGVPQNPGVVRRFMSKAEFKDFKKNGFKFDPNDSRGGISVTSVKVDPKNPDAIKRSTGALGADYYADINTVGKNVELKGKTKGGVMDWKIKDNVSPDDIINTGKVCK